MKNIKSIINLALYYIMVRFLPVAIDELPINEFNAHILNLGFTLNFSLKDG
jgi:hypothetical protein